MTRAGLSLGKRGEILAAEHLEKSGYQLLERNFRCPAGEIDLIAESSDGLIFVEVKARRSLRFGPPEESLTPAKQAHLVAAAQTFLQERGREESSWRIDVIAIELDSTGNLLALRHLENAVGLT